MKLTPTSRHLLIIGAAAILSTVSLRAFADTTDADATSDAKDMKAVQTGTTTPPSKPAPIPLIDIEGNGGILTTESAYIVNPPRNGEPVGRPAVNADYVYMGHSMDLVPVGITWSPYKMIELGYGWEHMSLGDLPSKLSVPTRSVELHNANLRFQFIQENEWGQKWLPAITFGVHYKYNDGITQLNKEVGYALSTVAHVGNDNGTDFTLTASKLITNLGRPVLIQAGGRETEAVWDGLGGFTNKYNLEFEGNVDVLVTDNLILGVEYKQMPRDYQPIANLYTKEDDWYTAEAAYIINKNWTVAVAYLHLGNVLNHQANGTFGFTTKWEF